jgi:hypothetical protein
MPKEETLADNSPLLLEDSFSGRLVRPGCHGELTQQVPFEIVDAVLADTGGAMQARVRDSWWWCICCSWRVCSPSWATGRCGQARNRVGRAGGGHAAVLGPAQARRRVDVAPWPRCFGYWLIHPPARRWQRLPLRATDGSAMSCRTHPRHAVGVEVFCRGISLRSVRFDLVASATVLAITAADLGALTPPRPWRVSCHGRRRAHFTPDQLGRTRNHRLGSRSWQSAPAGSGSHPYCLPRVMMSLDPRASERLGD